MPQAASAAPDYDVTALELTIYYNKEGDHDHNGLMFALTANVPIIKYLRSLGDPDRWGKPDQYKADAAARAKVLGIPLPTHKDTLLPHELVRPLVLRARENQRLRILLRNEVRGRWVGLHLVGDGYDVKTDDGSHVGANPPSLVAPRGTGEFEWDCRHQGVFPFHDGGNYSGGEDGTNVHGLFGTLIVEPPKAVWRDPVSGRLSTEGELDGLYMDVFPNGTPPSREFPKPTSTMEDHRWAPPRPYFKFQEEPHREFVIVFHDEPEFRPPHGHQEPDPCKKDSGQGGGGHGGEHDLLPIMPISYRAEPMVNREHLLWKWLADGHELKRPVLNEEQHHSSWMFGDPATPILKAYIGDPVRIRFVHAGVKETHVFHLHLYEWHAVPEDSSSPRIDAISVSPQTAHTIEPVWGAGNRHQVAGDVIWHCHLYPHFHEGMWGMFRTFETLRDGEKGEPLASSDPLYKDRRVGLYPDGTPIERLWPLPDRVPPGPTPRQPGYPLYIAGEVKQKSPVPPWPGTTGPMPDHFDYREEPTDLERLAFNEEPVPGELFTRFPFAKGQDDQWNHRKHDPNDPEPVEPKPFKLNVERVVEDELAVESMRIDYNGYGWHDRHGHLYYRLADGHPDSRAQPKEPLFFRARHGQILNLTLANKLPAVIPETEFDHAFPPCDKRPWQGECSPHVHMVKFDPICADGASVGWNYMSGPVLGKTMAYRWWLDREFGTIFFHDHLFANYRQKHGLFGALIVEPVGSAFFHPFRNRPIVSGLQARIRVPGSVEEKVPLYSGFRHFRWFREACIGIQDFIPMWDRNNRPLNPPATPGGHGDQGVMALNYRSDPIRERLRHPNNSREEVDPAFWFSSLDPYHRDPYTTLFRTYEGEPLWFRLVQGSHEEQHSFQVHGMRWRRFRGNTDSFVQNQQTFGIAEAFTFINHERYGRGDYLYKLSSADDLWLGCWGLIRAIPRTAAIDDAEGLIPLGDAEAGIDEAGATDAQGDDIQTIETSSEPEADGARNADAAAPVRRFHVVAERTRLTYREPDLVDPYALIYRVTKITGPDGKSLKVHSSDPPEPLILRCVEGETVELTLENCMEEGTVLRPEPFAPEVPVEARNPFSHRPERPVSSQVSMHADLVLYDVRESDGANVGKNGNDQSARPQGKVVYRWRAFRPPTTDGGETEATEALGPLLLQDMADFRNHRHHGLVGALIVEPEGTRPLHVRQGEATAVDMTEAWNGARATLLSSKGERVEEAVLLLQNGLRHFLRGNIHAPISDEPPGIGEDDVDAEDQGQKGFNYRSEPVGPIGDWNRDDTSNGQAPEDWLSNPRPATPVFHILQGRKTRVHLLGACDKPRNHSFTIHGVTWPEWRFLSAGRPRVASESAITTGTARTFEFTPLHEGDHAYRSGVLKWDVVQGLWGILRVHATAGGQDGASDDKEG